MKKKQTWLLVRLSSPAELVRTRAGALVMRDSVKRPKLPSGHDPRNYVWQTAEYDNFVSSHTGPPTYRLEPGAQVRRIERIFGPKGN